MAIIATAYSFYLAQPGWLLACLLLVPIIWLARRSLAALGRIRRISAVVLRCSVVVILVLLLARPMLSRTNEELTVIAVLDRSQSIPSQLQQASLNYLNQALTSMDPLNRFAMVDIAEQALIAKLPSGDPKFPQRNTALIGDQTRLAYGIQMALAIAPPDSAARIILLTEGNQTAGDLKEAARIAAANKIPIDVLPLRYRYDREVVFRRLAAPSHARSGQTVSLRFILSSTAALTGKLFLNLNGQPVDLDPTSPEIAVHAELQPGTNVKTVSVPLGTRGMHEFEATFVPDDPNQDRISQNNFASAITYVAGPGHVLVVDADAQAGSALIQALTDSKIDAKHCLAVDFPNNLVRLIDTDAVVLVDTDISNFTFAQQEMLAKYVTDLGGGLIMVGGPHSFGAGGWIGSPLADVLPVDLDPPQKRELPKGALVLIMHACEMPMGNYWGKQMASAAVKTLSRADLVGILAYNWQGTGNWVFSLAPVGDKKAVLDAIDKMDMGDMPSLHDILQAAYNKLKICDAAQRHVIVITDADPQPPTPQLLKACVDERITVTGVSIFPHNPNDKQRLLNVAQATGGRYYDVTDPARLPQIFVKEAQVVRRSLIVEESFTPQLTNSLSEIIKGLNFPLPNLDGYVLTGPKGGVAQLILSSNKSDPILAAGQAGLGRCVAFTSSLDTRWAAGWLRWGGCRSFWEQAVRWVAKPAQATDCEIFTDADGRNVTVNVEAVDEKGGFLQLAAIDGQVISPDAQTGPFELVQIGPGQYRGRFQAGGAGSYLVNLRYRKPSDNAKLQLAQATINIPFAPEFQDLSDNAPLLTEVAQITGGRILPSDPNQANLFDTEAVKFPETHLPLNRRLIFLWLALFLSDVAVRRIAVDFRAAWRNIKSFAVSLRGRVKTDETLDQLRLTKKKIQQQFAARSAGLQVRKRYEEPDKATAELPVAKTLDKAAPVPQKPAEIPRQAPQGPAPPSHIQQLLRAKRQAARQREDKKKDNNQ